MGRYLKQVGDGPALGIFQMEPTTYLDIWDNYLRFRPALQQRMAERWPMQPEATEMMTDLFLAAVLCRLHYRRIPAPLPRADDLPGLARYWKRHYNTLGGRGTETEFTDNWKWYMEEKR